ncbi:MAG: type III-B CRISPR module RAMP protein Cmr4 [Chitinophagales bacterium]|nr:type III-B CRISPR module RAMP protein Cmr4 [Chitinophagales bacterium]MCZ2392501.1 type III-B CRISPR module RAMP protein Cmr4 [Chitinophagales bacterium]
MNTQFYTIKTKSNTHVGSGQNSYGIVDNVVQKDYNTELPCINSTSLKGALREYADSAGWANLESIFGSKPTSTNDLKQGTHYFQPAYLLSYPMRSNQMQFFNVTCPLLLEQLSNSLPTSGLKTAVDAFLNRDGVKNVAKNRPLSDEKENCIIEKHTIKTIKTNTPFDTAVKNVLGNHLVIMHNDDFKNIVKRLPIITRNQLENGQSTNLFYEEVVPRETIFGFVIQGKDIDTGFDKIDNIQIGANATVGYGFCSLQKI